MLYLVTHARARERLVGLGPALADGATSACYERADRHIWPLGRRAYPVDERQGFGEVSEAKLAVERAVHFLPSEQRVAHVQLRFANDTKELM